MVLSPILEPQLLFNMQSTHLSGSLALMSSCGPEGNKSLLGDSVAFSENPI